MILYTYSHIDMDSDREHDCISGSVWGDYGEVEEEKRILESKKSLNIASVHEDNTIHCELLNNRQTGR
jgi:hypothetical protein